MRVTTFHPGVAVAGANLFRVNRNSCFKGQFIGQALQILDRGAGTGGGRRVCRLTHGGHCRITSYERKGGMDGMDEMDRWDGVGKRRVKIKLALHL